MAQYGDFYGQVDFTLLCRLWKGHKDLFQMVDFKDGKHALLKCNFNERKDPDEHGNTHYLQAACKKGNRKEGLNYYVSSGFKPSQNSSVSGGTSAAQDQAQNDEGSDNDLPF